MWPALQDWIGRRYATWCFISYATEAMNGLPIFNSSLYEAVGRWDEANPLQDAPMIWTPSYARSQVVLWFAFNFDRVMLVTPRSNDKKIGRPFKVGITPRLGGEAFLLSMAERQAIGKGT